jgi:plasmid stabilization system protein ParE
LSHRIILSTEARGQLDALYDYIAAAASPGIALRFTDAILDHIEALRDFPNRGARREDILPGLRTIEFRKRVTIAFVVEPGEVSVVGIFYGGQDFETILREDSPEP